VCEIADFDELNTTVFVNLSDSESNSESAYDADAFDLDLFTTVEEDRQAAPLHMKSLYKAGPIRPLAEQTVTSDETKAELLDFLTNTTAPVSETTRIFHSTEDDFFGAVVIAIYWFSEGFRGPDFWSARSKYAVRTGGRFEYNLYAGSTYLSHRKESAERHMVWHRAHPDYWVWYAQLPDLFKHFVNANSPYDSDEARTHREMFVDVAVTPHEYTFKGNLTTKPLWQCLLIYLGERP